MSELVKKTVVDLSHVIDNLADVKTLFDKGSGLSLHLESIGKVVNSATADLRDTVFELGKNDIILQQAGLFVKYPKDLLHILVEWGYTSNSTSSDLVSKESRAGTNPDQFDNKRVIYKCARRLFCEIEWELQEFDQKWEVFHAKTIGMVGVALGEMAQALQDTLSKIIEWSSIAAFFEEKLVKGSLKAFLEDIGAEVVARLLFLAKKFGADSKVDLDISSLWLNLEGAKRALGHIEELFVHVAHALEQPGFDKSFSSQDNDPCDCAREVLFYANRQLCQVKAMFAFASWVLDDCLEEELEGMSERFMELRGVLMDLLLHINADAL